MLDQQLMVGAVYRIKLKGVFERHGVCSTPGLKCLHAGNGVFRLDQITTFRDVVKAGVKIYDNFFKPLNISEDECNAYFSDKPADVLEPEYTTEIVHTTINQTVIVKDEEGSGATIKSQPVTLGSERFVETGKSIVRRRAADSVDYGNHPLYKFVDVIDPKDFIYVPELTLDGFPEIEIGEYKNLHLVFHLGYFDQPELLDPMLLAIRERMATYGVRPKNIKLYSTGSKWMNRDEYEAIRSIRVPGEIISIKDSEPSSYYAGEHVIINGVLKEIVDRDSGDQFDPETQVSFNSLKSGKRVLDNRMFLTDVKPGDRFDSSRVYYEKLVDNYGNYLGLRVLSGADECPHGEEIMKLVPRTQSEPGIGEFYKKVYGAYAMLDRGAARTGRAIYSEGDEHGSVSHPTDNDDPMTKETAASVVNTHLEKYYFVKATIKDETSGETTTWYRTATNSDVEDDNKPLYYKLVDTFVPATAKEVTEDTVTKDLYFSESRTGTLKTEEGVATVLGSGQYYYENYATEEALGLVGCNLEYTDNFGVKHTNSLELVDVIDFGIMTTPMTIINSEDYTESQFVKGNVDRFYTKYAGRRFRYKKQFEADGPVVTVEIEIPDTVSAELSGQQGYLLGIEGEVERKLFLHKDTTMKRNYYMQYAILEHEHRILQEKYNKLEKHVIATSRKGS